MQNKKKKRKKRRKKALAVCEGLVEGEKERPASHRMAFSHAF